MKKFLPRIWAVAASMVLMALAIGGYLAWGIAKYYQIAAQIEFRLALLVSVILLVLSAYWVTYAAIGYRQWSVRTSRIMRNASLILGLFGAGYVIWLLF